MSGVDHIRSVTEGLLFDNWSETPVAYDSVNFDSIEAPQWIRHTLLTGDAFQSGMPACIRHSGVVSIEIFTPTMIGTSTALQIADKVNQIYGLKSVEGVIFEYGTVNRVGYEDDIYKLVVFIPYRYDEILPKDKILSAVMYKGADVVHNNEVVMYG